MNESNIRQIMERFLNAETTLEEEQKLYEYFQGEDIADDLNPYREAFRGFASVQGIDEKRVGEQSSGDLSKTHRKATGRRPQVGNPQREVMRQRVGEGHTPAWVIVLRTVTSMAAVFLIGLFFVVNVETGEAPQLTISTAPTEPTPALCEGSTPMELYACYLEQKRPNTTYSILKQMIYENKH